MSPEQWLEANIGHWGVETGLHARLDASSHDDRCRLRNAKSLHLHSMFTRLADRLLASLTRMPAGLDDAWLREADDRMKAFHEGMIEAVAGPEALAQMRRDFPSKIWLE